MPTETGLDKIAVHTHLTADDYRALQAQCPTRLKASETPLAQWARIAVTVAVMGFVAVLATGSLTPIELDATSLFAGVVVIGLAIFANGWIARRSASPDPKGSFLGPCAYELDGAGLRSAREGHSSSAASWAAIRDVTFTSTHLFLWVDRFSAYTIPGRDLPNGLTTQEAFDWIVAARARFAEMPRTPEPPPTAPPPSPPAAEAPPQRRRGAWLLDVMSLIALRGKAVLTGPTQGAPATLTTLLAVGTWLVLDRWQGGAGAVFYPPGLSDVAWFLLGGLAVAWVFARTAFPRIALPRAIVVAAVGAWLTILYRYFPFRVESLWLSVVIAGAAILYALAYFGRAARALTGQPQAWAGIAAFLASAGFFWATEALWVYPMAWTPNDEAYEQQVDTYRNAEPLFFAQRERLDTALAAVAPSDPAATDLYFVGFAGYGDEKVFAEEIKVAARTVAERYPNEAGSVLLLNDVRDFDSAPFATATTLRYTLQGVAAKMQPDDDILFLALSSHGTRDWSISVSNGGLPLADLGAEELAAALDEAGIKWRVIVISACFAGGLIDALQDPYTIVVAAASPDRTSFGCSNERELTYFGEAFYRDALPMNASLRDAFATAEQRVLERESAEGIAERSQPMAFFGDEIERKLAALEESRLR
jgi:hypothetical protein